MHRRSLLAILLAVLGSSPLEGAPSAKLETLTLENGLVVLIRKVTSAKDAAVVMLFRVGNRDDPQDRSGMASLIANLYHCAATEKTPARQPDTLLLRRPPGSRHQVGWTALAADGHTLLARTLPSKEVGTEVDDAADRLATLQVSEDVFQRAMSNLRERLDNVDTGRIIVETARMIARQRVVPLPHGGRRPGIADQIAGISLEDVTARLKALYVPSNAILSITGDVEVGALRKQIQKRFGALPRGSPPPPSTPAAPAAAAGGAPSEETVQLTAPGKQAAAALVLLAPGPSPTLEYAAYMSLTVRLIDAWTLAASGGGANDAVTPLVDLLGDAEVLYLTLRGPPDLDPRAAAGRLKATLMATTSRAVATTEVNRVKTSYNMWFGLPPLEGGWADDPLGVAHADARRAQLELDGEAVMKLIPTVTTKDLAAAAQRATAIVVVHPGK